MWESLKTTRRTRSRSIDLFRSQDGADWGVFASLPEAQFTESEGHPWFNRERGDLNDIGGNFFTASTRITGGNFRNLYSTGFYDLSNRQFTGNRVPAKAVKDLGDTKTRFGNGSFIAYATQNGLCSSANQLNAMGATAIARCSPTQQYASAFAGIKEAMKDGLPDIPGVSKTRIESTLRDFERKKASGAIKGTAEEYLNVVFGWSPLLSDISNIYNSVTNWDARVEQFRRDAGQVVRRTYRFPSERPSVSEFKYTRDNSTWEASQPGLALWNAAPGANANTQNMIQVSSLKRDTWFSGAFTYHIPDGDGYIDKMRRKSQELDLMLGLSLTPESIWNASPWTWLVDWFVNAGDVITNISNMLDDGLVMHYGYVMEKSIWKYSYTQQGYPPRGYSMGTTHSLDYDLVIKQRRRATPFGFGLNPLSFSKKQLAILAALGITRV